MFLWWHARKLESVDHEKRLAAVTAIAKSRSARAAALLSSVANDSVPTVRLKVSEGLGKQRRSDAIVSVLVRMLEDRELPIRESAARSLIKLGWKPSTSRETQELAEATRDWTALAKYGRISRVFSDLASEERRSESWLKSMWSMKSELDSLAKAAPHLLAELVRDNASVRARAFGTMMALDPPASSELYASLLTCSEDDIDDKAADVLLSRGTQGVTLLRAARQKSAAAREVLLHTGDQEAFRETATLTSAADPKLARRAVALMAKHDNPEAIEALKTALRHADKDVAIAAASALIRRDFLKPDIAKITESVDISDLCSRCGQTTVPRSAYQGQIGSVMMGETLQAMMRAKTAARYGCRQCNAVYCIECAGAFPCRTPFCRTSVFDVV